MNNPFDLRGKKILMLGGSAALDKSIISQLEGQGAKLVLCEEYNAGMLEGTIEKLVCEYGQFDGLVFAVVHSDFRPLKMAKIDNVSKIINDNFIIFVETMRTLKKSKGLVHGASVVALSSVSSVRAMKAKMAFCSSKAALDAAVRCLAVELANDGIRVNSILKGGTDADFEKEGVQTAMAVRGEAAVRDNEQPLGIVPACEVANLVIFLLSDAVKTMTGTSIAIDGGFLA